MVTVVRDLDSRIIDSINRVSSKEMIFQILEEVEFGPELESDYEGTPRDLETQLKTNRHNNIRLIAEKKRLLTDEELDCLTEAAFLYDVLAVKFKPNYLLITNSFINDILKSRFDFRIVLENISRFRKLVDSYHGNSWETQDIVELFFRSYSSMEDTRIYLDTAEKFKDVDLLAFTQLFYGSDDRRSMANQLQEGVLANSTMPHDVLLYLAGRRKNMRCGELAIHNAEDKDKYEQASISLALSAYVKQIIMESKRVCRFDDLGITWYTDSSFESACKTIGQGSTGFKKEFIKAFESYGHISGRILYEDIGPFFGRETENAVETMSSLNMQFDVAIDETSPILRLIAGNRMRRIASSLAFDVYEAGDDIMKKRPIYFKIPVMKKLSPEKYDLTIVAIQRVLMNYENWQSTDVIDKLSLKNGDILVIGVDMTKDVDAYRGQSQVALDFMNRLGISEDSIKASKVYVTKQGHVKRFIYLNEDVIPCFEEGNAYYREKGGCIETDHDGNPVIYFNKRQRKGFHKITFRKDVSYQTLFSERTELKDLARYMEGKGFRLFYAGQENIFFRKI